jgi:hypothetical protein
MINRRLKSGQAPHDRIQASPSFAFLRTSKWTELTNLKGCDFRDWKVPATARATLDLRHFTRLWPLASKIDDDVISRPRTAYHQVAVRRGSSGIRS